MSTASNDCKINDSNEQFEDQFGLERLVFFSDAVFAIAITLLALEIHLPVDAGALSNQQLFKNLVAIWPKYLSFLISFLVIGNFWIAHHRRYHHIRRYDTHLMLLNLLVLMSIAFIPFPTAVISENGNRTATIFYALSIFTAGILSALLWLYASWKNRLLKDTFNGDLARRTLLSILSIPAIFLLSIGLAFINPDLAKFSWILIAPTLMLIR
ncbi:MAG: hypothetical protein BGO78_05240 [Chloroflexi bacterium 44-23]|nr:MAG: hypothetical protein BGO78_05240 [Chloroflexi bacterium 44-23]